MQCLQCKSLVKISLVTLNLGGLLINRQHNLKNKLNSLSVLTKLVLKKIFKRQLHNLVCRQN